MRRLWKLEVARCLSTAFGGSKMKEMTVLHIKSLPLNWRSNRRYVYIGRPSAAADPNKHWGNPFTHKPISQTRAMVYMPTREAAVQAFEEWLEGTNWQEIEPLRRKWILDNEHLLAGKDLVCWCAPFACHGDVYKMRWMRREVGE